MRVRRPLLQRVGWGMRREEIEGKWRRGMEGEEGEAVMEEVGTWWRTLGPAEMMLVGEVWGGLGMGWWETFSDIEGGEEYCFEHREGTSELHMP